MLATVLSIIAVGTGLVSLWLSNEQWKKVKAKIGMLSDAGKAVEEAAQTESYRQWLRLVVVYLLIPGILLICGGDLGWWQAWFYSLLIFTAGIGGAHVG